MPLGRYQDLLKNAGFQMFLWTQFLGAFNDNVYKMVVSMLAVNRAIAGDDGGGALPLVGAIFVMPFFLFSGYAGYLADRFSKRHVLISTKILEVFAMGLAGPALLSGRIEWMLAVLFLMSLQSTLFSPAKYGILPEILPDKDLSRANGLLEMSTFLAIILGTSLGSILFAAWKDQPARISGVLIAVAVAGAMTSFGIPKSPASGVARSFSINPWAEIIKGTQQLTRHKTLWLTVIGISYFWFLGALLQMDLLLLGKEVMGLDDLEVGILGTFLAVGIGVGSMAAGRLSGDKVELGLVPLGSIGMGAFSLWLAAASYSYIVTAAALVLLGVSGGLFVVPLNAFLQQKSDREAMGRIIATNNFMNTIGVLLASGALWLFRDWVGVSPDTLIFIFGLLTLAATVYLLRIMPDFLIRFTLWMLTHTVYKIRIIGQEHLPFQGPALLVCNHMSHVDGLLVASSVQRFIRFMIYRPIYELKAINWLFRLMKAIPIQGGNRAEVVRSLQRAREELLQGHVVCIFAEGSISRTGNLLPFKRGFERIVEGLDVPVIPVHLDRLWGSLFSFKEGRFFYKWPERIPYPVTVSFGTPRLCSATAWEVRQAVMELGSAAAQYRRGAKDLLHRRFIKMAKKRWFALAMADSTGREVTYGKALIGALLLARFIRTKKEEKIGLLLPSSVAGALSNIAVLLAGKIPVNLNFTSGKEAMAGAVEQCHIRTILSSRLFLAKAKLEESPEMVFLEDLLKEIPPLQKITHAVAALLLPAGWLHRLYDRSKGDPNALATVIFSSGSTGVPKGIMLSHHNILSNLEALAQLFWVTPRDRMMGVLPFFHSFGFTGTLWFPLLSGFGVGYHANPMDAKTIGEMVGQYKATLLISTPTFYSAYLRKCAAEEFASVRYAIVGAEKLREPLAIAFKEKYGLDLLEGYGCTEMGPVVSVNIPDFGEGRERQTGGKQGSVGHPLPGVSAKVVDPDTGLPLPPNNEGLLLVKGPNQMIGYLGQPEKTEEVLRDGWYVTGDIAKVDDDGFIHLTDRLSRFSKIGGEMVPHMKVEDAIHQLLGEPGCVVTAVPDLQKGEKLVVFYTRAEMAPESLWEGLNKTDLPKLYIPKRENFYILESLPTLGTGKMDLRKIKALAVEKTNASTERRS